MSVDRLLLLLLSWLAAAPALAHLTPNSEMRLDFGHSRVVADLVIPLGELGYALRTPIAPTPRVIVGEERERLARFLLGNIAVRDSQGRQWRLALTRLAIAKDGPAPDLLATLDMLPPPGASPRQFDLHYDAVIGQVPNHFVLVLARNDFAGGHLSDRPAMIGGMQSNSRSIRIDRGPGSAWRGFLSSARLGIHHITEGHDHLLFLLALILPAPLIARAGRWREYGGVKHMGRKLLAVVSAFTVGHSITLIGAAFFGWRLPAQPVEVMIAVSILVSALHAVRPLFAGREALVAGGFGLVHGLAFATLIGRFGLEPLQRAQSILGFNLGIEAVQLAVVAACVPALLMLAHTPAYRWFRLAGSAGAAAAALAWMVERLFEVETSLGSAIEAVLSHGPWLIAGLTAIAAALLLHRRATSKPAMLPFARTPARKSKAQPS